MNLRMFMAAAGGAATLAVNIKPGINNTGGNVLIEIGDISAEATGGVPPYTYRWFKDSGDVEIEIKAGTSTSQQATIESSATDDGTTALIKCAITDSVGTSAESNSRPASCVHGTPT